MSVLRCSLFKILHLGHFNPKGHFSKLANPKGLVQPHHPLIQSGEYTPLVDDMKLNQSSELGSVSERFVQDS